MLHKANNRPMCENSPNLVTLLLAQNMVENCIFRERPEGRIIFGKIKNTFFLLENHQK
jgi:hypothetical protein